MKRGGYITTAVLAVMLPVLASCRQELCYDHYPAVDVKFQWEQEWERDYGRYHLENWDAGHFGSDYDGLRPPLPEWINMIRYTDNDAPVQNFLSPKGAELIVEEGKECSILLYNGDTEYIVLSDVTSLNEAYASATSRSRSSLSAMHETFQDARSTNPPDILYAAYIEHVPALKNHDRQKLHTLMQPLVYTYVIDYRFEYGINHVALARGAIGGMAESVYLRTGVTSERSSIILFDCDIRQDGCQAYVRSFGIPGFPDIYYGRTAGLNSVERPYTLNLEVMLRNGKTLEFYFDVTEQMKEQPRGGVITVDGIRIEDDEDYSYSGFEVDVTEWNDSDEIIDLPIGNQQGKQ